MNDYEDYQHPPDDEAVPLRSVHIDYLTISIPVEHQEVAEKWCTEHLGDWQPGKGQKFRSNSIRFAENGASIHFDPPTKPNRNPTAILDIGGAGCQLIGDDALVEFAMYAINELGAHLTRLDIALDMLGGVSDLLGQIEYSVMQGEGCRFRKFSSVPSYSGQRLDGHSIYLGKRGKDGSGRSVCVYDKGLERKQSPQGYWVRWEARFANECADQALMRFATADASERMLLALDVVEFREFRHGETHISRRPMCDWWVRLRGTMKPPNIIKGVRQASSAAGLVRWVGKQVVPTLERIRRKLHLSWDDMMQVLASPETIPERNLPAHSQQLVQELQHGVCDDNGIRHSSIYEMLWNRTVGVSTKT